MCCHFVPPVKLNWYCTGSENTDLINLNLNHSFIIQTILYRFKFRNMKVDLNLHLFPLGPILILLVNWSHIEKPNEQAKANNLISGGKWTKTSSISLMGHFCILQVVWKVSVELAGGPSKIIRSPQVCPLWSWRQNKTKSFIFDFSKLVTNIFYTFSIREQYRQIRREALVIFRHPL